MTKIFSEEAQDITPTASVTAEVNQTAAGAWRGSVKVNVTAPITFRSKFFPEDTYDQVFAAFQGSAEVAESKGQNVEYSIRPMVPMQEPSGDPKAFVLAPTPEEYQIRESIARLLADAGAMVRATVDFYNEQQGSVEVKVKK